MIAMFGAGLLLRSVGAGGLAKPQITPHAGRAASGWAHRAAGRGHAMRGFSILELMVVIGIVSVLIVIAVPALRFVKNSAREARQLHACKQQTAAMLMYTRDWGDSFLFAVPVGPDVRYPITMPGHGGTWRCISHWDQAQIWSWFLAETYFGGSVIGDDFTFGGEWAETAAMPALLLSQSVLATSEFWTPGRRTGEDQWKNTRVTQVLSPERKVLLHEEPVQRVGFAQFRSIEWARLLVGTVNGAARRIRPDQQGRSYPQGNPWPGYGYLSFASSLPVSCSVDGVRGRDIASD